MQTETTVLSNVIQSHYLVKDLQKYHTNYCTNETLTNYCTNETLMSLRVVEEVDAVVMIKNGRYLV